MAMIYLILKMQKAIFFTTILFVIVNGFILNTPTVQANSNQILQSQGLSITSEVKAFLLNIINNAFLYNGDNAAANAFYITQKLNNSTYSGNWNTIIAVNCTYPSGYGAFSYQGSWWAYWAKVNQYALDWCYYLTKMPQSVAKYANKTGEVEQVGEGLTTTEIESINKIIDKGYYIYKGSQNGNAFFVSDQTGKALGGSWDVLVLNKTSQFYSTTYRLGQKWQYLDNITELNRKYFIRKVYNAA